MNKDLIRWRYMRVGDLLEYRDTYGNVKQIGPIVEIDWRPDQHQHYAPTKKYILVPARKQPGKNASVPLDRVQAVIRNGQEVIRFAENEQQAPGGSCAVCGQRDVDWNISGQRFCSLACQQEWIETYYSNYAPGENPIDKGEMIHTANCGKCRQLNRVYCPDCID